MKNSKIWRNGVNGEKCAEIGKNGVNGEVEINDTKWMNQNFFK